MTSSAEGIEAKLREAFAPTTHVAVVDDSGGCGAKYSVVIASPRFEGVPLLERHRLVNAALKDELATIHALSIKAQTPAQWAAAGGGTR